MTSLGVTQTMDNLNSQELGSLTAARSLIGNLHSSHTCTRARIIPEHLQIDHRNLVFMVTAALSMICNALKEASYYQNGSGPDKIYSRQVVTEAYAFIQGTGLDVTIKTYGLAYHPDKIRKLFNELF